MRTSLSEAYRGGRKDYSGTPGNPTNALQKIYTQLMGIQDVDELVNTVIETVQPLVGKGMSELNFRKLKMNLSKTAQQGLPDVQKYLTMYILAGSGMAVESETLESIASFITEDVSDVVKLTKSQMVLKTLVEHNSRFRVKLIQPYNRTL